MVPQSDFLSIKHIGIGHMFQYISLGLNQIGLE